MFFSSHNNRKLKVNCDDFDFVRQNFFKHSCFISMFSVFNKLSEHILHIIKHYFIHFCCLFLKTLKAFRVSLRRSIYQSHYVYFTTLIASSIIKRVKLGECYIDLRIAIVTLLFESWFLFHRTNCSNSMKSTVLNVPQQTLLSETSSV